MVDAEPALGRGDLAPERLKQANINPDTGLATDYLNHFNEVVMLLEMLPAMPECVDEVLEWAPMGYETHFEKSRFSEKQLAIAAYRASPCELRDALQNVVAQIDETVCDAQRALRNADDIATVAPLVSEAATARIKPLVSIAGAVIHGHVDSADDLEAESQASIDALFA